jgi:ubiquinone/menaquinone biosynthesis C-methylase UbiE
MSSLWSRHVVPLLVEKACRSTAILAERKRWIPRARGAVLELGIGSGLNLAFYDAERVTALTGIDPSAELLERAAPRAKAAAIPVELVHGAAEALPFGAATFDSVVVTYSLCSVADPARVLDEVRRVLRPGGELVLAEHGLAPDARTRRWQQRITPVWRRLAGGCHLDRDIGAILRHSGYATDQVEAGYGDGAAWLSYTFQGIARPD